MAITFNGKKFILKARSQDFHETVTTFLEFSISSSCSPIGIGSTLDSWWRILALPNLCYRWLHLVPSSKSFVPTDNDNISLKPFAKLFCDIAQLAHTLRIKDFNQCLPIKNEVWFEYVVTDLLNPLVRKLSPQAIDHLLQPISSKEVYQALHAMDSYNRLVSNRRKQIFKEKTGKVYNGGWAIGRLVSGVTPDHLLVAYVIW
ncbi:hypothetical protein VNO77_43820 [Canavalia gladiata]|uniref:Uncharacterized protein n=1 Tax=Canavalia gladiata TaxID=3824 RepID=A0AAN9JX46_CANGL